MNAESEPLARLRALVDGLQPSAALRDAVLHDLPVRRAPRRGLRRADVLVRLAASVVAAAAIVVPAFLLRRGGDGNERRAPVAPVVRDLEAIAKDRARNVALYERERERLHREVPGKWVSIADRAPEEVEGAFKPLIVGETLGDVASHATGARHRFVFRVGEEGDVTTFASAWYAPRFAGPGLAEALDASGATRNSADGTRYYKFLRFEDATPFPRVMFRITAPGVPSPRADAVLEEVFVGSVGPALMLTPEDDADLHLERWEVPGTETVMGVRCRRVLVAAAVPATGATGTVVACVPDVPYTTLVAMSRARHRFWEWADSLRDGLRLAPIAGAPSLAGSSRWIVFGNDRVLGDGPSAEAALAAADAFRDVVFHRYVLPWPRPEPPSPEGPPWGDDVVLEVGGVRFEGKAPAGVIGADGPPGGAGARPPVDTVFVPAIGEIDWVRAGFHRAEDGVDPILDREEPQPRPGSDFVPRSPPPSGAVLRAAYARVSVAPRGEPSAKRERFVRVLAYVVPR